jgi:hypothetical protein
MTKDQGPMSASVNELLSYALFYFERSTKQHLQDIILEFYDPTEILAAKDALWEQSGSYLGNKPDRRQSATRDVHVAALADIIQGIDRIDRDDKAPMPVFAALNFDRIPKTSPVQDTPEATSARLDTIEKTMSQLCQAMKQLTEASPVARPIEAVSVDPAPPTQNTEPTTKPLYRDIAAISKQASKITKVSGKIKLVDMESTNDAEDDDFRQQYASQKKQRRKMVIGSRTDSSLKGNQPNRHLFVYQLDKETTVKELTDYLNQSVRTLDCSKISHQDARNASFKVTVSRSDAKVMLCPDFWPLDVRCRYYVPPKNQVTS